MIETKGNGHIQGGKRAMRSITAASIAVVASVAVAACGSTSSTGSKSTSGNSTVSNSTFSNSTVSQSTAGKGIGITRDLTYDGGQPAEDIAVTLLKVIPSASSAASGFGPGSGDRWVAMQFQVKNLARAPYTDSPAQDFEAIDAAGQTILAQDDAPTTAGPSFPGQVALTPGETVTGVVTFEIGSGDTIPTVEFIPGGAENALVYGAPAVVGKWAVG
jgi:hypothetical protein